MDKADWEMHINEDEGHIIPQGDIMGHSMDAACVCNPKVTFTSDDDAEDMFALPMVFLHSALDGRPLPDGSEAFAALDDLLAFVEDKFPEFVYAYTQVDIASSDDYVTAIYGVECLMTWDWYCTYVEARSFV